MKILSKWTIALFATVIMFGCNDVDKLEKADNFYKSNGYYVAGSNNDKNYGKLYLLLEKNSIYYLDTKFKNKGKSAQRVYPNEKGNCLKTLEVSFYNGVKGVIRPIANTDHVISFNEVFFHDNHDKNGKDLLLYQHWVSDYTYYYIIGSQDVLYLPSKFNGWNTSYSNDTRQYTTQGFTQLETFTFADLYDNYEYEYEPISLKNYSFTIEENFSIKDLSFLGFSNVRLKKTDYPWQRIKDKIGQNANLTEDAEYLYFPASWIGTVYMNSLKECIEKDIQEKIIEWDEEEDRVYQEEMRAYMLNEAVDYEVMMSDFSHNSIKAHEVYQNHNMILKIKIDRIDHSYRDGYSYVLENYRDWVGLMTTDVYTNDVNFTKLDYPCTVIITAKRENLNCFTDAELWLW